jgi:hypothetical protein
MFNKKYEERLQAWKDFRDSLEEAEDPFRQVIEFYSTAPLTRFSCDPWDRETWADPWQLLEENQYCEFGIVLGMCYSLQLTDRFKGSNFEIHISTNNKKSETHYLLFADDAVLGYESDVVLREDLSKDLKSQTIHVMPSLQ